jgi:hypothetical protein
MRNPLGGFGYPPDNYVPSDASRTWTPENGMSEALVYYTCSKLNKGLHQYGPYVKIDRNGIVDLDGDGYPEYQDPFGSLYLYAENASDSAQPGVNRNSYDLVSSGFDCQLGGTMSPSTGYVPASSPQGQVYERDNVSNWRERPRTLPNPGVERPSDD